MPPSSCESAAICVRSVAIRVRSVAIRVPSVGILVRSVAIPERNGVMLQRIPVNLTEAKDLSLLVVETSPLRMTLR